MIKYNQPQDKTYSELERDYAPYARFKAFQDRKVYGCNTNHVPFYEESPFHPELLLKDLIKIFHPELLPDYDLKYFSNFSGVKQKGFIYGGILAVIILLLMAGNLFLGAVSIPASAVCDILTGNEVEKASWSFIVWESRFPQCITALLCGAALSVSGLMLQTIFSNPLADPSILGISSGASLGVALVMLAGGGTIVTGAFTLSGFLSVIVGAFAGASVVMGLILFLSTLIRNSVMLLIAGIMIGYITSSAISLLNFFRYG